MDVNMINELKGKRILHWNYRGLNTLPDELKHFGELVEDLYLKWNNITALPPWIVEMKFLTNLYLYGNGLVNLPDEIGEMKSLSTLSLENNKIRTLPKTIGNLKNLNYLILELNQIEFLPTEIGQLKSLYVLNMKGNGLKELPSEVCLLNSLQELILDCNQLTCLPRNIVYLPNLNYLSINLNLLLYLPSIWFMSNPQVRFSHNSYLNYLSYDWGCALTKVGQFLITGSVWHFDISGCTMGKLDSGEFKVCKRIMVADKVLILPPFTKFFSFKRHYIPSLFELAIRNVYTHMFGTKDIRQCLYPKVFELLPKEMKHILWQGPLALCHHCKKPIFTECILSIIVKYILTTGQDLPNPHQILACIYFCSNNCTLIFAKYELDNENELLENISSQQLEWTIC
ncbi:hypothetical protein AAG570_000093 [Ranatra chinensis]|uniref:Disease resistance R13L4/SHOC-2-like LRR domain-containing protein n=1 Tax=Ranatra chinensis TaxID=642074 RepID=A0ABD0YW26_9HEMI